MACARCKAELKVFDPKDGDFTFGQTLTKAWSRSWLAVHLIFGSLSRQCERKSFPSGLNLSGIGGLCPIPTLYII